MTIDLDDLERLAKAAIARGEEIGEESWYSEEEFVCNMLMHPDDAKFSEAANPTAILELVAEVRRLRERLDVPYRASSDCQYAGASEQIKCAWADGWNQCVQYIKGSHDGY
jgi:hypothetical protein